jgi:hypothetical protein
VTDEENFGPWGARFLSERRRAREFQRWSARAMWISLQAGLIDETDRGEEEESYVLVAFVHLAVSARPIVAAQLAQEKSSPSGPNTDQITSTRLPSSGGWS